MKKVISLTLIFLCFAAISYAQTEKEFFDEGVRFFKQGQYQQAIDSFSELIKLDPDNADAYKNRGVSYMKQEKFDLAISDFQKAKKLFPELKGLYSNLGVAWYYKKEYEKAIENYDLEIQMASENPVAYFNRALCLAELGRNDEALDDLSKTLELKPDFYWAICYKADLLAEDGQTGKAVETYEKAIQTTPKNTYATQKLAQLRKKLNKQENMGQATPEPKSVKHQDLMYTLQTGAFRNKANAGKMKNKLIKKGFDSRVLILADSQNRTWYLVRSGSYPNKDAAKKASLSLKESIGVKPMVRPLGVW